MKVSCTIEVRKIPNGGNEILLEKSTGNYRDSKLHREFFTMPDSPETELFLRHLKRLEHA